MKNKKIDLNCLSEEELLNTRICDLSIKIQGTWLESCIQELYSEIDEKGLNFRPICYLADEWLTPDGEPVVGIPFFLAHPALIKLEKKMMLEVEGSTHSWCMMLLRHETGHALNYAYKLYRRKKWQNIFGKMSKEYADTYRFRPYSKNFVRHLEDYYAQYHPDEDFAETFAVWLNNKLDWREKYKGWKAINKLNYVDTLMDEIKTKEPIVENGEKYWVASDIKKTLKSFYNKKKHYYAEDFPDFHDQNLKKMFKELDDLEYKKNRVYKSVENKNLIIVYQIIKKNKRDMLINVAKWTGEKKYIIDNLLEIIEQRCKLLKLVAVQSEVLVVLEISVYITALVMNYIYTGRFRKIINK